MLTKNYLYYVWKIFTAGLLSPAGIAALLTLAAAIAILFVLSADHRARRPAFWLLLIVSIGCLVMSFRGAVYTFDEQPDSLDIPALSGEPDCGSARTGWIRGGYGIGNPCQKGCYRGKVVSKEMRMRGLPPWPEYRREMQCWARGDD